MNICPALKEIEKIKEDFLLHKFMYEKILQEKSVKIRVIQRKSMKCKKTINCNHCRFKCLDNLTL